VITNGSDADSSGGSKVVANSIDGEDELVDVSKVSNGVHDSAEAKTESPKASAARSPS
jgi:ubiquitin carboxyl-terminal hydrolase 4/11